MTATAYSRLVFTAMKWIAAAALTVMALIAVLSLSDLTGLTNFGYPIWSIPLLAGCAAIVFLIRRVATLALGARAETNVQRDRIEAVGIDSEGSLWIKPRTAAFPYIYREAMDVRWDADRRCLTTPKPREWSYVEWFRQAVAAAREQGVDLVIDEATQWSNVAVDLRETIATSVGRG